MVISTYSPALHEKLKTKKYFIENGKFTKRFSKGEDSLETIYRIEDNKAKLTQKYYAFIERAYMLENIPFALENTYYEDYITLEEALIKNTLNKQEIFIEIITFLEELKEIGIDYWDIHNQNILVKDHIKVVDLAAAVSEPKYQTFEFQSMRILELAIEMFFLYNLNISNKYCKSLLQIENIHHYFSKRIVELIKNASLGEEISIPYHLLLKEFNDEEKALELRKIFQKSS